MKTHAVPGFAKGIYGHVLLCGLQIRLLSYTMFNRLNTRHFSRPIIYGIVSTGNSLNTVNVLCITSRGQLPHNVRRN